MTSPLQQKIKITGPVVLTANRVGDGAVIYRNGTGDWTTELDDAVVTTDVAQARSLLDAAAVDGLRAVDPYLAPVMLTPDGEVLPANLRERIRQGGPTIDLPVTFGI
jgi:predicted NAD/FAD-binding protein